MSAPVPPPRAFSYGWAVTSADPDADPGWRAWVCAGCEARMDVDLLVFVTTGPYGDRRTRTYCDECGKVQEALRALKG